MKYLTLLTAFLILFMSSCTKLDTSLPDNIFSGESVEGLFEDVNLVYLNEENKARISYEVNFDVLSSEQRERITGFFVDYNGTPQTFGGLERRTFAFPVPIGEEVCVRLGVSIAEVTSTSITPICKTF